MGMNKGNILNISESVHFHSLLKESMLDCMQGAYTGFWIVKSPNRNFLPGFCWLWGNTVFLCF